MRNLKRALSLTLASVMLLGMMVVGSSAAAGYSDVDENDNVEAIEVLQAVEVMVGDDRGFGPDRPVTRNEMAVVMGKLLNLDYNYYVSTCPFTDVADWARGWVGAAAANGIVSGRGNGIYDGEATVTAVEAASMMMRALGYFKYTEDYADGFLTATVRQGSEIGIFNDVGTDATTPMTRNQVAQMALNALRSNMVTFTGTTPIDINGVSVAYRAEYTPRTGTEAKYDAITGLTTTILSDNGQYFIQLGEQLYDGDLRLDDAIDDYGRPARHWEYDGKGIGTYAKREIMRRDFTVAVKGADMYDVLGSSVVTDARYTLDVYVDGAEYTTPAATGDYTTFTKNNFTRNNDQDLDETGRGVLTEVYVDTQSREITVAIINTYLAKATSDYSNAREELRIEVYTNHTGTTTTTTPQTLEVEDFPEIANMKEDDFMLIKWTADSHTNPGLLSDYNVDAILDTEIMSDKTVTRFTHDNATSNGLVTSLVTDGQTYNGNENLYYDAAELEEYNKDKLTNKTYNVYLDQYGNAIGVDLYSGEDNYVFITGFDLSGTNTATGNATANAIFMDGTMASIKVNVKGTNDNIDDYNDSESANYRKWVSTVENTKYGPKLNTWYTYTLNETTNVYTLDVVDKDKQFATAASTDGTDGTYDLKSSSLRLNGSNYAESPDKASTNDYTPTAVSRAYGDQNSVFITVGTSEDTSIGNQFWVIDEVKSVYTGVQNVNITSDSIWYDGSNGKTSAQGGTPNTGESSIYALIDSKDYIIGAIVIGKDRGSTENYAYIYDTARYEERDADGTYFWGFNAVVNGERQEIKVKSEYPTAVNTIHNVLSAAEDAAALAKPYGNDTGYLFRLSFDKDGYVVDAERFEDGGMVISTTSAHNDYIFAYGSTDWNINADDEIVRYMKIAAADADELRIDRDGLTLYNNDQGDDEGLAVRPDAKITIIQTIRGSRRIAEATGLREAWDYLVDYTPATEDTKNYAGTISAVLDGTGRATWVVFDSKGGTDPSQSEQTGGSGTVTVSQIGSNINIASTTALDDAQIRAAIRNGLSGVATVEYPDANGKASITFTNGDKGSYTVNDSVVANAAAVSGANKLNQAQKAIGSTSTTGAAIEIDGNTITTKPGNATASEDYVTDAVSGGHPASVVDLRGFLLSLRNNGARSITYGGATYSFNASAGQAGQWQKSDGTTLVSEIVTAMGNKIGTAPNTATTRITETIVVDGSEINVALDYTKA